ncbi:oxidoreductase [Leifsonia sp. Root227]|uniref:Gfo/Idh/MocA family protein n=1 Tax=Leifsonia sp. Root227 TaxID=1736496 RepID=UPI0006F58189|nr:Gfo/Idh/MocA family oxidoreductase [Leifsonia sp. Root227]KRC47080.1 oxidoreductase [Leifsonia sp. Root227]
MSSPLRIAVVGLDHWYAAIPFAEQVARRDDTILAAVVDRDPARASEIAGRLGCERVETDPGAVIEDSSIDAIACFTSVDQNAELCKAAARAGKHIVSVKPLAMTMAEADAVVDAVEESGVVFIPSESRRTSPLAAALSSWVHGGRLGELRSGAFAMNSSLPKAWPGESGAGWWIDPRRTPGGAWIDHAVYQIDRMRWLFGSEVVGTTGVVSTIAHTGLPVEDYGHAVFTLASGAVVTVEDTWVSSPGGFSNRGHLVGSEGSVFYDSTTGMLGWSFDGEPWTHRALPSDTFDTLDALVDAVQSDTTPLVSVRDARATLSASLRFYSAAATVG